jgi:hypothetical protein
MWGMYSRFSGISFNTPLSISSCRDFLTDICLSKAEMKEKNI